jgi:hypothetical protein
MFLFFDNPKDKAIEILKDYDKVTFTEMGESKKKKMLEFSKVYAKKNEDELKRLYKKHYMMSKRWVKIFLLLQVLKRIKIDMKLFNPPGSF